MPFIYPLLDKRVHCTQIESTKLAWFKKTATLLDLVWFLSAFKRCFSSCCFFIYVVNSPCVGSLMRSTEVGVLFSRSETRRQLLCCGIYRLPSPLWLLVVLMLLIRASTSGVGEQIGIRPLDCCGMRLNTSKCWTDLTCVCEDCGNRTEDPSGFHGSYRLEFCSSFPIIKALNGAFQRNRTFCQEQINILRRVDNLANRSYQSFEGIIERTDCGDKRGERANTYSATSTCSDCLVSNLDVNLYHILLMKDVKWCWFCVYFTWYAVVSHC